MREALGDAADLALGDAQHLGHFGKGAAGLEGGEAADDGGVRGAIFFEDQINDVVFAVVGEVHVNVGQFVQRHALFVEEAAEVEIETDGADAADAQAIAGERIGGAAAGDPFDAAPATFLEDVPDDEEVFLVADFSDDGELLLQLGFEIR